ncbi:MAG: AraC family transcriptional regulator [Bacteroidaceae bacterium]|nr:AraC family transcriptional regulator [Bacteroidaceae bacterium]
MVGFLTPRYFSQCFQNVFGISPLEYRANCSTQNITQHT